MPLTCGVTGHLGPLLALQWLQRSRLRSCWEGGVRHLCCRLDGLNLVWTGYRAVLGLHSALADCWALVPGHCEGQEPGHLSGRWASCCGWQRLARTAGPLVLSYSLSLWALEWVAAPAGAHKRRYNWSEGAKTGGNTRVRAASMLQGPKCSRSSGHFSPVFDIYTFTAGKWVQGSPKQ